MTINRIKEFNCFKKGYFLGHRVYSGMKLSLNRFTSLSKEYKNWIKIDKNNVKESYKIEKKIYDLEKKLGLSKIGERPYLEKNCKHKNINTRFSEHDQCNYNDCLDCGKFIGEA